MDIEKVCSSREREKLKNLWSEFKIVKFEKNFQERTIIVQLQLFFLR